MKNVHIMKSLKVPTCYVKCYDEMTQPYRVLFRKFLGASGGLKVKTHLTLCKIDPDCQKKKHLEGCKYGNGHWPTLQVRQYSRSTDHRAPGWPGYKQHSGCWSGCCSWEHSSPTVPV